MTEQQLNNPLRECLAEAEKPMYDAFVMAMGRKPESMMDLMQGGAVIRETNKTERDFWNGVFGL